MKLRHLAHSRGFTLTEVAIVLGVFGIVLAGIWAAAGAVYETMRVNKTTQQLQLIVQNMRNYYASRQIVGGSQNRDTNTAMLVNARIFPRDMLNNANMPESPWGTPVRIVPTNPPSRDFLIFYNLNGVGGNPCGRVLASNIGQNQDPGLQQIFLGQTIVGGAPVDNWQNVAGGILSPADVLPCTDAGFRFSILR